MHGLPGRKSREGHHPRGAPPAAFSCQLKGSNVLHAGSPASVWGGGETEEQEAGVEGEGGGEDEGGEGDAVGHQDEGEEPTSAWSDFELNQSDMTH